MKVLSLLLLAFLSAGVAAAQDASGVLTPPGVEVTKSGWRREVRNPALDEDPMQVNQEQRDIQRVQRQAERQNRIRSREGLDRNPPPKIVNPSRGINDGSRYVEYVYEIKITNTGPKKIRALEWSYVLLDPGTGSEAGVNRFLNEAGISPGKSKGLVGRSPSPPARVVDVSKSDRETRGQFSEYVVIHRIIYEDGTTWQHPGNSNN
jgi:hypothetical protein